MAVIIFEVALAAPGHHYKPSYGHGYYKPSYGHGYKPSHGHGYKKPHYGSGHHYGYGKRDAEAELNLA